MEILFLNPAVEAEVRASRTLTIVWGFIETPYNGGEPIHDDTWVKAEQAREVRELARLKAQIHEVCAKFGIPPE